MPPTLAALPIVAALLLALPLAGCSAEAKKSRALKRGELAFAAGKYEAAKIEYMKVIQLGGENPIAIERLGTIWYQDGAPRRALPFLIMMRQSAPANIPARLTLARTYQTAGSAAAARTEAMAILQQTPNNADAFVILAESSSNKEQIEETQQQLDKSTDQSSAAFHLASATLAFKREDLVAGKAALDRALAADPKSAYAHLLLGGLYAEQKDFAHAQAELKIAADLSPIRSIPRLKVAELKAQQGHLDEARADLKALTAQAPDFLPAWRLQAQYAMAQKKPDEALALLENIFTRDPENLDGRMLQADAWLAKNETKKAVAVLERLNTTYPNAAPLKFALARTYLRDKNLSAAVTALSEAISINPDFPDAVLMLGELNLRNGEAAATIALMTELLKKSPTNGAAQALLAEGYRMTGRWDEAAALARQLLQQTPKSAPLHLLLGITLRQQNKPTEARENLETVRQLAPDNLEGLFQLVDMDLADKKPDAALERLRAQIEKSPASAPLYVAQGKIYLSQKDLDQAEAAFVKALDIDPSSVGAYELLIATYVGTKRLDQAVKQSEALLAQRPGNPRALMTLGAIYEHQKDFSKARDMYEKLISAQPDFVPALNNLAYLYSEQLQQLDKAYDTARKARAVSPDDPAVADTLGWILYKRGSYPEAFTVLQESSPKLYQVPEAQYHLGMAAYMMGQTEVARAALEKAATSPASFPGKETIPARLNLLGARANAELSTADLEARVKADPGDLLAQVRLGAAYQKAGEVDKAAASYEQAAKLNPKLLSALTSLAQIYSGPLPNPTKALDYARRAKAIASNDPAVSAVLGHIALQSGDAPWAYSLLKESAAELKDDPKVVHDLAWAAYAAGNVPDARKNMQRVPEIAPTSPEAADAKTFLTLTAADGSPDQIAAAQREAETVLKTDPAYVPALMVKAASQSAAGQAKAAIDTYSAALKRFADFAPAEKGLALLYADDPANQAKAYEFATKARRMLPDDLGLIQALARIGYAKKEYASAANLLEESARKKPLDAKGLYYLGMSQAQLKRNEPARKALEAAITAGLEEPLASQAKAALAPLQPKATSPK